MRGEQSNEAPWKLAVFYGRDPCRRRALFTCQKRFNSIFMRHVQSPNHHHSGVLSEIPVRICVRIYISLASKRQYIALTACHVPKEKVSLPYTSYYIRQRGRWSSTASADLPFVEPNFCETCACKRPVPPVHQYTNVFLVYKLSIYRTCVKLFFLHHRSCAHFPNPLPSFFET